MNHALKFRENSQRNSQRISHFSRKYMKCSSWKLGFFVCIVGFPCNFLYFFGHGQWGFMNIIHFSMKDWCFHTFIIRVAHNVCCICYEGFYLASGLCTSLGELNLLNTQNNLLKEPSVKPWWFGYGSSCLNCRLSSFSVEVIWKADFSKSEFDLIIGNMFITCATRTLVQSSLLFNCTKYGNFMLSCLGWF